MKALKAYKFAPRPSVASILLDRDPSFWRETLLCGRCEKVEVKDENEECAECQAAALEHKEDR